MKLRFDPRPESEAATALRAEVRDFLAVELGALQGKAPDPKAKLDREFSEKVGAKGWIGLTWPTEVGGHGRSYGERYALTEEMIAAQAPIRYHFVADRQSGPVLIRYAQPHVRDKVIPEIMAGRLCFCIGMSEPDSGSDLFAARAKAEKVECGWRLNGRKLWTSTAHFADYMIGIFRTSPPAEDNRRFGLTQFLVDMRSSGIEVRPILYPSGAHEFNEVLFEDVFVTDDHLLGEPGAAWKQATSELAFERSGPERFMDTYPLLPALIDLMGAEPDNHSAEGLGRMTARLHTYRHMAMAVAGGMDRGMEPVAEASVVKAGGTGWERDMVAEMRRLARLIDSDDVQRDSFEEIYERIAAIAPKLTIQGGTIEILLGIVARDLGLR
ncbi:MAG: acyl-CoA dehydrogenase [Rhodospirillaceae bacterium]|nr:acyl-CoA dehydrogenase [Rhodospirillaceae bacterium]|tara:strand:- start:2013 stop:3161 length:1149 start_codon:yes stop_codon:yes gene_type:complete